MSDDGRIERLLREEAEGVLVAPQMPAPVRRRIRVRQGITVTLTTLSIIAVALAVVALPLGQEAVPPAGDGAPDGSITPLASSREDGVKWRMELRDVSDKSGLPRQLICFVVGTHDQCWDNERNRYGEANIVVDYIKPLDRAVVIVKTPPDVHDVQMREISGTLWGGMVASEGDPESGRPAYFYRLFEGPDVYGILTISGADVPKLEFSVQVQGATVKTSVIKTNEEFPELKAFPGDKEVVASGPDAGGYSVYLRTTDSEVCLHILDAYRCRDEDVVIEPIRLWVAESLTCTPADLCGSDNHLTIIAGQVGPDVAQIGIRDRLGTSYVQIGEPFGEGMFSTTIDGRPAGDTELVAFDSAGNELDVVPLEL